MKTYGVETRARGIDGALWSPWTVLVVLGVVTLEAGAQQTHWGTASGDWSQSAPWSAGEPTTGTDAYIGSDTGAATASVGVTMPGEACDELVLGYMQGNKGTLTVEAAGALQASVGRLGWDGGYEEVVQNGGTVEFGTLRIAQSYPNTSEGTRGKYTVHDGNLQANWLYIGEWTQKGEFFQRGGTVELLPGAGYIEHYPSAA